MDNHSNSAYEFWNKIGSPKTALAPMVDYCDLPFRILCRKYNTQLTYTQMYNSISFITSEQYRNKALKELNKELDNPCFMQLNGHDPELLLQSVKYVEHLVPCVDINLGCPQQIAKHGYYGAFLLDHPEEVYKIIGYLCNNVKECAISCKIRLFNDLNSTYELVRKVRDLGIKVLCVHGRTKEQNKEKVGETNWEAIHNIKHMLDIPVISNGGLGTFEDIDKCFELTGCDCVMSGEKLIEMPTYFTKSLYDIDDIVIEYLNTWKQHINEKDIQDNISIIRGHLFKFYYKACQVNNDYNQRIATLKNIDECFNIAQEIKEWRKDIPIDEKYGWYMRHRNKDKQIETKILDDINNDCILEDAGLGDFFG